MSKSDLTEAEFKSDDGVSTVPDVEFDKDTPATDLKKYQAGEGKSKDQKNKDHESNIEMPMKKLPKVQDNGVTAESEEFDEEDTLSEAPTVNVDEVDVSEDLAALFGEDADSLSEDFKARAETIFKAAVVATANRVIAEQVEAIETKLIEENNDFADALVEKMDAYMDKIVEDWRVENEVAIERNLKTELAESFLDGLKDLFEQHYIEVPEDRVDVVNDLQEALEALENRLDEEINRNVALKEENEALANRLDEEYEAARREHALAEAAEGLSEAQKEKLALLSEGVDFEDDETFSQKLVEIKESYFKTPVKATSIEHDEEPVELNEEVIDRSDPEAKATAEAIGKFFGKRR